MSYRYYSTQRPISPMTFPMSKDNKVLGWENFDERKPCYDIQRDAMGDNFEYWKSAFKYEMANHEYAINWQADWDTLSAFGNIQYHGHDENEVEQYFDELHFTETQRKAYWAARREYMREANS